jgi:hypothetical protein
VVPAVVGTAVMADVGYTTMMVVRRTYDLSMIVGSPLSPDDHEDLLTIFSMAVGGTVYDTVSGGGKALGPRIVAYNARRILRMGLRRMLVEIVKRIGGSELAKKLTERALVRLAVPGVSVPIALVSNYLFIRHFLEKANKQLRKRGGTVQPLVHMYSEHPELDRTLPFKVVIAVVEAGGRDEWDADQLDILRYAQNLLSLDDAQVEQLDRWFDRSVQSLVPEVAQVPDSVVSSLILLMIFAAAMWPDDKRDGPYAEAIHTLAFGMKVLLSVAELRDLIQGMRGAYA